jgi:hypothetical protein
MERASQAILNDLEAIRRLHSSHGHHYMRESPSAGNYCYALRGNSFWEAERGLRVEFVDCRLHIDVE